MRVNIHGKIYDLERFADRHPGGRSILELCAEEADCTGLFESYHAFCDMDKINQLMRKYDTGKTYKPMFKVTKDGFYKACTRKVREFFGEEKSLRSKIKISFVPLMFYVFLFSVFTFSQWQMFTQTNFVYGLIFSILSGFSLMSMGFNILHDASHYGLSLRPSVNVFCSNIIQVFLFLNHTLWSYHHTIRHHQYTGDNNYDPDIRHTYPFFRKSITFKRKMLTFHKDYIRLKILVFNILFPGAIFGQALLYHLKWVPSNWLWNMKLPQKYQTCSVWNFISLLFFLTHIFFGNWFFFYLHVVMTNLIYFVGIAPNHDMYVTHIESEKHLSFNDVDWGEMQVRNTANFCNNYCLFTSALGNINYQIEHHLFPSVSNNKLKDISHIVKKICKEYGVPYNQLDKPFEVYDNLMATYETVH